MLKRWDIFCKVVDNFGDIGVCWRLARQLKVEHQLQIRLWIDDLGAAQKIISSLNVAENNQICEEITILKWPSADKEDEADFSQAADVVIEAFACGLPPKYLAAMAQQQSPVSKTNWINLEYLSAEHWVEDFHGKPSPQANGLTRYFYFPGFTEKTGGLIRERNIGTQLGSNINPLLQVGEGARQRGRGAVQFYLDGTPHSNLFPTSGRETFTVGSSDHNLKVSLFCYLHAPIHNLLAVMAESNQPINCYVPASSILPQIAAFFGLETVSVGDCFTRDNLHVHILPFLSQTDYDALLRDCDINFVRGEDSWVRAIWAGKPFIWQPYFQAENAHIKKLDAFLDLFYADIKAQRLAQPSFPLRQESILLVAAALNSRLRGNDAVNEEIVFNSVAFIHHAWLTADVPMNVWQDYLDNLPALKSYTLQQSKQFAQHPNLAAKLVIFCNKL